MSEDTYRQIATEAVALLSMHAQGKDQEIENLIARLNALSTPTHHTFEAAPLDTIRPNLETP